MPSLLNGSSRAPRFELPALNLNFGSITDGTNIPPPPDSPVQKVPTPPQTPPPTKDVKDPIKESNDESKNAPTNGNLAGTKRNADDAAVPLSPAASSRQGSIRRLFSRTTLNNSYVEGQMSNGSLSVANGARPSSQGGSSFMDERKSKRSSGWFRRIRTGDSTPKRSSTVYEAAPPTPTVVKKPSGPPPPMIPELTDLEKDEGSLGDDLFKNIK
ncbi:hypothetical protein B0T10DRAFT_241415 [Thelonectria olida]|uniref:Uncharacterized protein n=1 Tax=Thelonectria olida TaxID=1576542 RepID=A0A9P8WAW6_9HYPO|nr:hypothetical protein B0T10DRAFT_241415 [Thelonectria olida]